MQPEKRQSARRWLLAGAAYGMATLFDHLVTQVDLAVLHHVSPQRAAEWSYFPSKLIEKFGAFRGLEAVIIMDLPVLVGTFLLKDKKLGKIDNIGIWALYGFTGVKMAAGVSNYIPLLQSYFSNNIY